VSSMYAYMKFLCRMQLPYALLWSTVKIVWHGIN
jgi:hypothetical protein